MQSELLFLYQYNFNYEKINTDSYIFKQFIY